MSDFLVVQGSVKYWYSHYNQYKKKIIKLKNNLGRARTHTQIYIYNHQNIFWVNKINTCVTEIENHPSYAQASFIISNCEHR